MRFNGAGLLLDIEGTTSSVSFVYDVMFPMVRERLDDYLASHWGEAPLADACEQIAQDAGHDGLNSWLQADLARTTTTPARSTSDSAVAQRLIADEVRRLMDGDIKATGLKQLQGIIWQQGFASGELQAHVYSDVPDAIGRWAAAGKDVRIYSSGSVQAQKLFFGHTVAGDLLPLLSGHYDTTTGPKRETESYAKIIAHWGLSADDVLFISDVAPELDAALEAGLQTALCVRPGNAPAPEGHRHPILESFAELHAV